MRDDGRGHYVFGPDKRSDSGRAWDAMTSPEAVQVICNQMIADQVFAMCTRPVEVVAHLDHVLQSMVIDLRGEMEKERTGWVLESELA